MTTPPAPQADPLVALSDLPGVGSAYAAAGAAVDVALRGIPRRRVPVELSQAALVETTLASSGLEDDPPRWMTGARRLAGELIDLARRIRVTPGTVLARMHLLLARDVVEEADLGRVVAADTARLADLGRLLSRRIPAPAGVLGAVAHAELIELRPFGAGSGIIARAVEHLILIEAGVDPVGVIMVERAHAESPTAYAEAGAAYATGTPGGVGQWLRHCAAATARGAELSPTLGRTVGLGT